MSITAIGLLERGARRAPYRGTVALLSRALGLSDAERAELERAVNRARASSVRREPEAAEAADNLPLSLTSFVGRDRDVARLHTYLLRNNERVITITGPGGAGKSRLALETARRLGGNFPGGVWLVELASVTDPDRVPFALARVLGLRERDDQPLLDTLAFVLRHRKTLIVLDNCEHVLDSAASVARVLEAACPEVRIVATSREPLRIAGELTYTLAPLACPRELISSCDEALAFSAVELFVRRASALGGDTFEFTDETLPAVVEIVKRLDGLPLAIELAVPNLLLFDVNALAERFKDRFRLRGRGRRDALPQHQTLRAMIDWSYERLSTGERFVFEACAIFPGTFTPGAVVALCKKDVLHDDEIFNSFVSLVDKSLVTVAGRNEKRYYLLDSLREFALQRLADSGRRDALCRVHAAYYLGVAQHATSSPDTVSKLSIVRKLQAESHNFHAALIWSLIEGRDPICGAELCVALFYLFEHESFARSRHWINRALDAIDAKEFSALCADLTFELEALSPYVTDARERLPRLEAAIAVYRARGSMRGLIMALGGFARANLRAGDVDAATNAATEAVALARQHAAPKRLAWALLINAQVLRAVARQESTALLREILQIYNPSEPDDYVAFTRSLLAEMEYYAGNVEAARDLTFRAVEELKSEPAHFKTVRAILLGEFASYSLALDDVEPAREAARQALKMQLEIGDAMLTSFPIQHLALAGALRGDSARAASLLGYCVAATASLSEEVLGIDLDFRNRLRAVLSTQLASAEFERLRAEGAAWSEERAAQEAFEV